MAIYIYALLGLLIAATEIPRFVRNKTIDALAFFNIYYFIFYVFAPLNVILLGEEVVRQKMIFYNYGFGTEYSAISLFLSYLTFVFGFWVNSASHDHTLRRHSPISLVKSLHVTYFIFILGLIAITVHIFQVGGIVEVITKAKAIRSGEYVIESKYLFFRHFSQFLSDAFVLSFLYLIGKSISKVKITFVDAGFFVLSFALFIYYGLSTMGRRTFIYPLLLCYLVCSSLKLISVKHSFLMIVVISFIAGVGTILSSLHTYGDIWEILVVGYNIAVQGLSDSFLHFVGSENAELWQFGFLTDIHNLPRDFFPSKLFNFERTRHMYGETSEFFLGRPLQDGISGEEALGLHGYLLVNFGYFGMFQFFFLLGIFYKFLHNRFRPVDSRSPIEWLVYWWVIFAFFVYFRDGVLILVIKQHLTWWITIIALMVISRKGKARSPT